MYKTIKGILRNIKYMVACMLVLFGISVNGIYAKAAKGDIAINQENFKNPYFRIYVRNFDTNKDDILSASERNKVTGISCKNLPITDFKGIEYFTKLTDVRIEKCPVEQLDLSKNTSIVEINLYYDESLKKLNLSNLKSLKVIRVYSSAVPIIDVSDCTELVCLMVRDNDKLEKLDFSNNPKFTQLSVHEVRNLNTLNCKNCKELRYVEVRGAFFVRSVNFSDSEQLEQCEIEQMDMLQVVQLASDKLEYLKLLEVPNLKTLDLSNTKILREYYNKGDMKVVQGYVPAIRYAKPLWKKVNLNEHNHDYMIYDSHIKVINNVKVNTSSSNTSAGTVTGGGVYSTGAKVTVTVNDKGNEKFQYEGLKVNEKVVTKEKTYTFTALEDVDVEAEFSYWFLGNVVMEMSEGCVADSTFKVRLEDPDPNATYKFQWKRDGKNIKGATGKTYATTKEDVAHIISCTVTSSRGGDRTVAFGSVQKKNTAATPRNLAFVSTSYKGAKDGKILGTTEKMEYCAESDFKNSKVCGKNSTTGLAAGKYYIRLRENETTKAGPVIVVEIEEGYNKLEGSIEIYGDPKVGKTLNLRKNTVDYLEYPSYQWKRDGKAIQGETGDAYTLQVTDLGCTISCTVKDRYHGGSLTGTLKEKIVKADAPDVPDGITSKAPSKYGLSDGHIFGVTKAMEYSTTSKFTTKKACGENKLTLKAGTYYIRYAETKSTKAGKALKVVIPNGPTATDIFSDVKKGDWFEEAVKYVYAKGIMNGVSGIDFKPQAAMTRAEFVTTLYNFAGRPGVTKKAGFKDVVKGSWYEQAVNWAYSVKITTGVSKDKFGTNDKITRQQAATMFYQYAKVMKLKTDHKDTALNDFSDKKKVASWAKEAFEWAVSNEVIGGKLQGKKTVLAPDAQITRAECAQMIKNMVDKLKK